MVYYLFQCNKMTCLAVSLSAWFFFFHIFFNKHFNQRAQCATIKSPLQVIIFL